MTLTVDYLTLTKDQLLVELNEVVLELCEIIEDLGFARAHDSRSVERYQLEAKRDILTERKYLIARILDAKHKE